MRTGRRAGLSIGLICAIGMALGGAAQASPAGGGVKGDPQPELKPFKIGSANAPGSVALEPGGAIVTAYGAKSGTTGETVVCVLKRGGHSCPKPVDLHPLDGDSMFGTPQVFALSDSHLVVLQGTCCDNLDNSPGDNLLYSSTDGGKTFGPPVRVGTVGVDVAALVGNDIVVMAQDNFRGAQVQSVQVTPTVGPATETALANSHPASEAGVSDYRGGVLAGSTFAGSKTVTTFVEYAPKGSDFGASKSYRGVGSFAGEDILRLSGDALLTVQTGGKQWARIRLFNGHSFGAPHNVPGTSGGGPELFTADQDPSGAVHVFSIRGLGSPIYHLIERTTKNGSSWSGPVDLGNAIQSTLISAALDSRGSGLVLGTDPAWGYPVLGPQSVSFGVKSSIRVGQSAVASGKVSPAGTGRVVTLQVERSGKWFTAATTHEKSGGAFSFTIKGKSAGSFRYRAVASDLAGYLLFGYSNAKSLRVTG